MAFTHPLLPPGIMMTHDDRRSELCFWKSSYLCGLPVSSLFRESGSIASQPLTYSQWTAADSKRESQRRQALWLSSGSLVWWRMVPVEIFHGPWWWKLETTSGWLEANAESRRRMRYLSWRLVEWCSVVAIVRLERSIYDTRMYHESPKRAKWMGLCNIRNVSRQFLSELHPLKLNH